MPPLFSRFRHDAAALILIDFSIAEFSATPFSPRDADADAIIY